MYLTSITGTQRREKAAGRSCQLSGNPTKNFACNVTVSCIYRRLTTKKMKLKQKEEIIKVCLTYHFAKKKKKTTCSSIQARAGR